jgi:hypothetical protein
VIKVAWIPDISFDTRAGAECPEPFNLLGAQPSSLALQLGAYETGWAHKDQVNKAGAVTGYRGAPSVDGAGRTEMSRAPPGDAGEIEDLLGELRLRDSGEGDGHRVSLSSLAGMSLARKSSTALLTMKLIDKPRSSAAVLS